MQCPRCQHENRPQARFCDECAGPLKGASPVTRSHADDLKAEVESLRQALIESLEQQRATSEILSVISQSPTQVQPIFDAIVRSAVRLCDGVFSIVLRFDGEVVHFGAQHNFDPDARGVYARWFPRRVADDHLLERVLVGQRIVNLADVTTLSPAFDAAVKGRAQAVMSTQGPFFNLNSAVIAQLALKHWLPGLSGEPTAPGAGMLLFYGPNVLEGCRRAANYVDRILKGAKPADLPVEQPTKIQFVINLKTAKTLGLTIPPSVLARADEVIQQC
jgi:hypothetical protein